MAFLKNDKLMIEEEPEKIQYFLRYFLLKTTSDLKNSPGYVSWPKKLKNNFEIALKPTGIKL